jgi:hypothetical protein
MICTIESASLHLLQQQQQCVALTAKNVFGHVVHQSRRSHRALCLAVCVTGLAVQSAVGFVAHTLAPQALSRTQAAAAHQCRRAGRCSSSSTMVAAAVAPTQAAVEDDKVC